MTGLTSYHPPGSSMYNHRFGMGQFGPHGWPHGRYPGGPGYGFETHPWYSSMYEPRATFDVVTKYAADDPRNAKPAAVVGNTPRGSVGEDGGIKKDEDGKVIRYPYQYGYDGKYPGAYPWGPGGHPWGGHPFGAYGYGGGRWGAGYPGAGYPGAYPWGADGLPRRWSSLSNTPGSRYPWYNGMYPPFAYDKDGVPTTEEVKEYQAKKDFTRDQVPTGAIPSGSTYMSHILTRHLPKAAPPGAPSGGDAQPTAASMLSSNAVEQEAAEEKAVSVGLGSRPVSASADSLMEIATPKTDEEMVKKMSYNSY